MQGSNKNSNSTNSNNQKDQDLEDLLAEDSVVRDEDLDLNELVESVIELLSNQKSVELMEQLQKQDKELIDQLMEKTLSDNLEEESLQASAQLMERFVENDEDLQEERMQNLFGFGKDPKEEASERALNHTKNVLREVKKANQEEKEYIRNLIEDHRKYKTEIAKMLKEGSEDKELIKFLQSVKKLIE